jgi:hypothetical protein
MNRRQFVTGVVGTAAAASLTRSAMAASSLQSAGGSQMSQRQLDTLVFSQDWSHHAKQELAFNARSVNDARAWQRKLRRKLTELIGGFPEPCPLQTEVSETKEFEHYTRETVLFQSRPNLTVYAYFLLPTRNTQYAIRTLPCIICLPGHGRGVDSICGVDEKGNLREWGKWGEYQNDFALQCVANGYAVLAIEQLGFGYRRDPDAKKRGAGASSCQPAAGAAFLFGQTMVGWRVYDVMRAIDYLQTRKEVDPKRIATMGISGGGTISFFSAALDTRIKVAVISGYFNTFKDSIMSISHCIDNYVPNILNVAEMSDIAGLIAPRAMFVESGTRDNIFPIEATKASFARAQKIYGVFGASDKIGLEVFEGEHQFWGKGAFEFLKQQL